MEVRIFYALQSGVSSQRAEERIRLAPPMIDNNVVRRKIDRYHVCFLHLKDIVNLIGA